MKKRHRSDPTLAALAQLDLFQSCTDKQFAALLPHTDRITVAAGTVIDRSGTRAGQLVGIIDGYVEARDEDSRSTVLGPGAHIGAVELIDGSPHRATYTARSTTSLVVIFGLGFRAAARSMPVLVDRAASSPSRYVTGQLALAD